MLHLPTPCKIGQRLNIRLFFPSDTEVNFIEAVGEVVWQEIAFGDPNETRCGVKFLEISAEDLKRLKEFLDHLVNLKNPFRISPRPAS